MKCLEFKQLALTDPQCSEISFIEHSKGCVECLDYVTSIQKMDASLAQSLEVKVPSDLAAKLELNQALNVVSKRSSSGSRYALAASVAIALVVGGLLLKNQANLKDQIGEDHQDLLAGVVEHMLEQPATPVWEVGRANREVNSMLASYGAPLRFKQLDNLQFGKICPMGKYRGLHASLETDNGKVTFVYVKGNSVSRLLDSSYQGYVTRIKPLRDGNLVIISHDKAAIEEVDAALESAAYWEV